MKERIKLYRKKHQMTQAELAEKIKVTQDYVSMMERGIRKPGLEVAYRMAKAFGLSMEEIFF